MRDRPYDGGRAAPRESSKIGGYDGMKLRDYFAGKVLSLIASSAVAAVGFRLAPAAIAAQCYDLAQAMVDEKWKRDRA